MQPQPPPTMASNPQPVHYPTVKIAHGEDPRGSENRTAHSTPVLFSLNVTHSLIQLCLGGIVFYYLDIVTYYVSSWYPTLKNHIILCIVGYFLLIAQAILLLSPVGLANNLKQKHKIIIHATLQTVGSVLGIAGSLIKLTDTGLQFDGHSICGLITMILTIISFISGILNFKYSQKPKTKYFKLVHSSLGTATISMAFICLIFGLNRWIGDVMRTTVATLAFIGMLLMSVVNILKHINGDKSVNMK